MQTFWTICRHTQTTLADSNNSAFTMKMGTYQGVQLLKVGLWAAWVLVKLFRAGWMTSNCRKEAL